MATATILNFANLCSPECGILDHVFSNVSKANITFAHNSLRPSKGVWKDNLILFPEVRKERADLGHNPSDSHTAQHGTRWKENLFARLEASHTFFVREKTDPDFRP